jgi:hypothetical protein
MYNWVEDKIFLKRAYSDCADTVNRLVQELKKYDIEAKMYLVGSKSRNMVTQNENGKIDFDFNLELIYVPDISDCRAIKEGIMEAFNLVLNNEGLDDCKDSTSAITTGDMYFKKGNQTEFSIDVCIVRRYRGKLQRLIHHKTGVVQNDQWVWETVRSSNIVREKVEYIKKCRQWEKVRKRYLKKKNMYLTRNDNEHNSFTCYVEALNEVYYMLKN